MAKDSKPWEKVTDPKYFKGVLGNFVKLGYGPKLEGKAQVRFGNTGDGHAPHYQIELDDGTKHCFLGPRHKSASEDEFNADNLSEERFTYSQVQAMLARLL